MNIDIWGKKFKSLKLNESKLYKDENWNNLFNNRSKEFNFNDNKFDTIIRNEKCERYKKSSIITCPSYVYKIVDDEYINFLSNDIWPILNKIRDKLSEIDLYFTYLDSFINLGEDSRNKNPVEYYQNYVISMPIIYQLYILLQEKIAVILYSLFDPNKYIYDDDANFPNLFKIIDKNQNKFTNIRISILINESEKLFSTFKNLLNGISENYKNYIKPNIVDYFKTNMKNYVCKFLKHSTTFFDDKPIKSIPLIDLFFIFSYAWRYLYWDICEILFPKNNYLKLDQNQIELIFKDKNGLFDIVHLNNDKELEQLNEIWKDGNYWKKIKSILLTYECDNKFKHSIEKTYCSNKYKFDTYNSLCNKTFDNDIKNVLKKIIDDNETKKHKDLLHAIIEYLSKLNT